MNMKKELAKIMLAGGFSYKADIIVFADELHKSHMKMYEARLREASKCLRQRLIVAEDGVDSDKAFKDFEKEMDL